MYKFQVIEEVDVHDRKKVFTQTDTHDVLQAGILVAPFSLLFNHSCYPNVKLFTT